MQVYQTHPEHGRHIAETSIEAKANIAEGWKTTTKKAYREGIEKELKAKQVKIIQVQKDALKKAEEALDE